MKFQIGRGSVIAKILAKENLNIVVSDKVNTAMFDLKNRIITIPNLDVSINIHDLFVIHELSHAKYTPHLEYIQLIENKPKEHKGLFSNILNVVEDVRIDDLIQNQYPGCKKWYSKGIEDLLKIDFFELKNKDINDCKFLQRLNFYFKSKHYKEHDINFNSIEQGFVDRLKKIKYFSEVEIISEEIFQYCLENSEFDESDSTHVEKYVILSVEDEMEVMNKIVKNNDESYIKNSKPKPKLNIDELIIGDEFDNEKYPLFKLKYLNTKYPDVNFYNEYKNLINFCISEFERKKSAQDFSKVREFNTGNLDLNKLYQYSYNDDIFKNNQFIKNHKNHGFVFLVDLSSSMTNVISKVFTQLMIMNIFCKKLNIPFEVYGFTSGNNLVNDNLSRVNLTKLFDNKISLKELISRSNYLIKNIQNEISFGSTPLTSALILMRNQLLTFKKINNVEILNFILLSDGECDNGHLTENNVIVDKKTKLRVFAEKTYTNNTLNFISPLFDIIKESVSVKITVMFLSGQSYKNNFEFYKNKYKIDNLFYVNSNNIFNSNKSNDLFLLKNVISNIS